MLRAVNLLNYGATRDDVRDSLMADGASEDMAFLAYVAATWLLEESAHG